MRETSPQTLDIIQPDDWHLHLRDGTMLDQVAPASAEHFGRAIIMPNLVPPVVTSADAVAYKARIMNALGERTTFEPMMTLYLTEETDPDDVEFAFREKIALAVKLYPAGATTNSASGVRDMDKILPVLERMAKIGMTLCVHGEVTDPDIDIFDREAVFIDKVLKPIRRKVSDLKVVMEHVTTKEAVDYVRDTPKNLAATITTHHLIINRNHILAGGIRPHYYCLPVAKREKHRLALVEAAVSGDQRFFLGTDSAPHTDQAKLQACGCAGVFSAPNTMSCLAEVFEAAGKLKSLEAFTSKNGANFYQLPYNARQLRLSKGDPVAYAKNWPGGSGDITVFDPGFALHWRAEISQKEEPAEA